MAITAGEINTIDTSKYVAPYQHDTGKNTAQQPFKTSRTHSPLYFQLWSRAPYWTPLENWNDFSMCGVQFVDYFWALCMKTWVFSTAWLEWGGSSVSFSSTTIASTFTFRNHRESLLLGKYFCTLWKKENFSKSWVENASRCDPHSRDPTEIASRHLLHMKDLCQFSSLLK